MHIHYDKNKTYHYVFSKNRNYVSILNDFLRNTLEVLDYLYENNILTVTYNKKTPKEKTIDIIDALIDEAPESIHIVEGKKNQYSPATNTIKFKHQYGVMFRKDYKKRFSGSNIGYNSPMSLLAHEIIHCYHELFDENGYRSRRLDHSMKGKKVNPHGKDLSFPNKKEELVIRLTNQVIKRLGEDKRRNYGRDYYLVENVLSTDKKEGIV
jgi:hypothetical protein